MGLFFDEYQTKNTRARIQTEYVAENNVFSAWKASDFTSKMAECIYKMDLLNTLAMVVDKGINPESIFIMDASLKLNKEYRNLSTWRLDTEDIGIMHSIGRPYPLKPTRRTIKLNLLLQVFEELDKILYKRKKEKLTAEEKSKVYRVLVKDGHGAATQFVYDLVAEKIESYTFHFDCDYMQQIIDKSRKAYADYLEDEEILDELNFKIVGRQNNLRVVEQNIVHQYYYQFYDYLRKFSRPVAGVYYHNDHEMKVICSGYFEQSNRYHSKIYFQSSADNHQQKYRIESGLAGGFFADKEVYDGMSAMDMAVHQEEMKGLKGLFECFEKDRLLEIHESTMKKYKRLLKSGGFEVTKQIMTNCEDFVESGR